MKKTIMLKKNYEFKNVLSKGKYFFGNYVIAVVLKNRKTDKNVNFLGLAISSKAGKAVRRNRIKRLIRESYYLCENNIKDGYSIVFLWNKHANCDIVYLKDIKEDVESIFNKANLWISE